MRNTSTLPNLILSELEDEGQIIRKAYQRRLPSNTAKDYYFMQRNTGDTQSITVEYGFLDNANDSAKLKNNYIDYTDAVIRALLEYIGYSGGDNTYTVKSGDSFWSIAKKFDVSVQELKDINNLTSNLLKVGQVLIIPQKQTSTGNTYIVKSGDTLYSIANKYNTTVDNLKNLNNLTSNTLSIGDTLKVSSNGIVPNNMMTYTVKKGDSLYSIANNYNVTVQELKNTNNLNSNLLNIGQVLNIPTELDETIYVVKRGDNLYSIANKYNTTVDEIKRKNGLTTNLLNIGQTLMV